MSHTALPWTHDTDDAAGWGFIRATDRMPVARTDMYARMPKQLGAIVYGVRPEPEEIRANADYICHAVNFHQALVDALAGVLDVHPDDLDPQLPPQVKERYRKAYEVWGRAEGNT